MKEEPHYWSMEVHPQVLEHEPLFDVGDWTMQALEYGTTPDSQRTARVTDISKERFGRLVATRRVDLTVQGATWECLCDCGRTHRARLKDLRFGNTRSCGCLANRPAVSRGEVTPRQALILQAVADGGGAVLLDVEALKAALGICESNVRKNVARLVERGRLKQERIRRAGRSGSPRILLRLPDR